MRSSPVSFSWVTRLSILVLAASGCRRASTAEPATAPTAPVVWVESEPGPIEDVRDSTGWAGAWLERFPGRPGCQDRFTLTIDGSSIQIESIDCTNGQPYHISEISWDGQVLRFVASPPDSPVRLSYSLELRGPGKIAGTANETAITWSQINQ